MIKNISIVLFGPECTGKTTLCKLLAKHYKTEFVPEFARTYAEKKKNLTINDVLPIAEGQKQLENTYLAKHFPILFYDTNLLETLAYSNWYYNYEPESLINSIEKRHYTYYFLTDVDIKWEEDGIRDLKENRQQQFNHFKNTLIVNNTSFSVLSGNIEQRLQKAIEIITNTLNYRDF